MNVATTFTRMDFVLDDGGRTDAGFKGSAGDCVTRAVAIVSGKPYAEVYAALSEGSRQQRLAKRKTRKASARNGVTTRRKWFKDYMTALGFEWVPTMHIGSGCKVHLTAGELPLGRLIVSVSKHYTAVIDCVIHDTFDPQRTTHETGRKDGVDYSRTYERCVYGYWRQA